MLANRDARLALIYEHPPGEATIANGLPAGMELVLKTIPRPKDANANGDISGGWVMAQCDLAGSMIPARHAQCRVAMVATSELVFKQPVRVGDILSFYAKVDCIWGTSIRVKIEVMAECVDAQGQHAKVTQATFTYVAVDDEGLPRPIRRPT